MKPFKVRKHGKTRGRPLKYELVLEHIAAHIYHQNQGIFKKVAKDVIINGVGVMKVKWRKF